MAMRRKYSDKNAIVSQEEEGDRLYSRLSNFLKDISLPAP